MVKMTKMITKERFTLHANHAQKEEEEEEEEEGEGEEVEVEVDEEKANAKVGSLACCWSCWPISVADGIVSRCFI